MDTRGRRNQANIYTEEQVKRVLSGSGIDVVSQVDSDYIIYCPFHSNNRTPAGEIDKVKGTFFCFSCHKVADLVEFVMHVSSRSYFEAIRFIKSKETENDLEKEINKKIVDRPEYIAFDQELINKLSKEALDSDRALSYFSGRKINKSSVIKFGLGFSSKQDMVTVPVHSPDGLLVGFVGRSVEGKEFKNTPGLPKSKLLFNLNRVKSSDKVYVVESSFDVIRLDQVGFPAVATLGANVSNSQIELLKKFFNDIIVVADNDEAGGNMKTRIIERLGSRVSVIQLDDRYKDIGDMEDEDIQSLDYSFDKSIMSMLK
jgi:DNA primase